MSAPFSIVRIGVVSPLGIGFDAFRDALQAPAAPAAVLADSVRCIDAFDPAVHLGPKGTATLDRMTQLAIAATGQVLDASLAPEQRRAAGIVLGSASGGLGSIADFVRTTYTAAQPHLVSPMQFPNTVMNCATGQCAIWHGLKGINASLCAGELSGIAALQYAGRMLARGHAADLVAGAVEEYSQFGAAMHRAQGATSPFAEGGAVFRLRQAGAAGALATVHGIRMRVLRAPHDADQAAAALAHAAAALLDAARVRSSDLGWWSAYGAGIAGGASPAQQAAMAALGPAPACITLPDLASIRCGASLGAGTALQLAGALALAPRGLGLVTAISAQGMLACMLIDHHGAPQGVSQ